MLDISHATNMLTALGVSGSVAAKAAERTAQQVGGSDPVQFLKELQSTLEQLANETSQAKSQPGATVPPGATAAAATETARTKPYQATAALYSEKAATGAASGTAASQRAAQEAPFSNLEEFKQWEQSLGDTFAEDYEVPDYVRLNALVLSGGNDTVAGRYTFFKNHPEFAADYAAIRSGQLSKFPTDGSTLVKSDLAKMPAETAAYYKANPDALLAAEGFAMDPTLAQMRMSGTITPPTDVNTTEWLMTNKWTEGGIVAQDNRGAYASADYIGLDGKGAGTYRLGHFDPATGSLIGPDGAVYDPVTGEARASA